MKLTSQSDVVVISEHHLYENQLFKLDEINTCFASYGKCADGLDPSKQDSVPGHGGIAILWNKSLSCKVRPLPNMGTDRICAVSLYTDDGCISVIGVYLPHAGHGVVEYQKHVDVLEYVIEQCKLDGDVIVIGDFNPHFGKEEKMSRSWGVTTTNGRRLLKLCNRCALTPVDMGTLCKGPEYTFGNDRGHISYVDHCIISNHTVNNVLFCEVCEDVLNTSDHLALSCSLNIKGILNRDINAVAPIARPRVAWQKMSQTEIEQKYTKALDAIVSRSALQTSQDTNFSNIKNKIAEQVEFFEQAIKSVSSDLPVVKYQKHFKSYWNQDLSDCVHLKKVAWKKWVDAGKPRDQHPLWIEYKNAKRQFRKNQKRAEIEHENQLLNKLTKVQELDQKLFWQLINRRRQAKNLIRPVSDKNGKIVRDIDGIVKVWGEYFTDLYTPKNLQEYDNDFKKVVDREIEETDMGAHEDSELLKNPISIDEVKIACKSLKIGKASGLDGIQGEHLKYAGPITLTFLTKLFNLMTIAEWRPQSMKTGIIVPIPKPKKDQTIPDNNRGITLRSVLGKVYDKILLERADGWFVSKMHEQQGANRKNISSLHTAMALKETIVHNRIKGKMVYVALLDTKKAFDTVWQNGLFYKLKKDGMDKKVWRILKHVYDEFQCAVNIGGRLSNWFHPQQGVHQGDVFSMKFYGTYNNGLITELAQSGHGAKIGTILCGVPTFADDVAIAALSKIALNAQLNIAYKYGCKWRFQYGVDKTQGLAFGDDLRPDLPIKIGHEVVRLSEQGNHLGTPLLTNSRVEECFVQERISDCRGRFFSLKGVGSRGRGFDPATLSKLYWAVCVPKMLYGVEITSMNERCIERLEAAHCNFGRIIQNLPPRSALPANYALLGWRSIKAQIDINRLVFLYGILSIASTILSWKIYIKKWTEYRFNSGCNSNVTFSPVGMLYETAKQYGLLNDINKMIDTGQLPGKLAWKKKVKQIVDNVYCQKWKIECNLYSSLNLFTKVATNKKLHIWWVVCKKNPQYKPSCEVVVKLITGDHNLNCGRMQSLQFHSDYVIEWNEIYLSILRFVHRLYKLATAMRK